jgi:hypothetical protein
MQSPAANKSLLKRRRQSEDVERAEQQLYSADADIVEQRPSTEERSVVLEWHGDEAGLGEHDAA